MGDCSGGWGDGCRRLNDIAMALCFVHLIAGGAFPGVDHFDEAIKEIAGIVWAGACFGVVLNREDRL